MQSRVGLFQTAPRRIPKNESWILRQKHQRYRPDNFRRHLYRKKAGLHVAGRERNDGVVISKVVIIRNLGNDGGLNISEDNGAYLDGYRFDTLDYFIGMAELVHLGAAA